jgi:pyrroline-5-carboxylate reductase
MRASEKFQAAEIIGFDPDAAKGEHAQASYSVICKASERDVLKGADTVILAVKPQVLTTLMPQLAKHVKPGTLIVSIAAGKELSFYEAQLPASTPVVRVMPNINAMVGAAAIAVCGGSCAEEEQVRAVEEIFSTVGQVFRLPEKMFSAFTALSGSSVAFAYLYIDAIARAGVKAGFSKAVALEISAAAALGSAKMVQESGKAPMELVDMVCSPAGTTIEGVLSLQQDGFEAALHHAVDAVIKKDQALK